jgi:phenylpyruvate tautomerase PptA (4-oxalocrotonate tautomerase family)
MPLVYVDLHAGRTADELGTLLDALHDAVVTAFEVPPRDRYQVVRTHDPAELVVQDTGLGIPRTANVLVVHVVSRRRTAEQKQALYRAMAANLRERCGTDPADLLVSITENEDVDWSFGHGRAQFVTGEL